MGSMCSSGWGGTQRLRAPILKIGDSASRICGIMLSGVCDSGSMFRLIDLHASSRGSCKSLSEATAELRKLPRRPGADATDDAPILVWFPDWIESHRRVGRGTWLHQSSLFGCLYWQQVPLRSPGAQLPRLGLSITWEAWGAKLLETKLLGVNTSSRKEKIVNFYTCVFLFVSYLYVQRRAGVRFSCIGASSIELSLHLSGALDRNWQKYKILEV